MRLVHGPQVSTQAPDQETASPHRGSLPRSTPSRKLSAVSGSGPDAPATHGV